MTVPFNAKTLEAQLFNFDNQPSPFYGLFYGWPGSGKTVLAAQIAQALTPEGKGIVLFDASNGWVSLRNHPELKKRAKGVTFKELDQLRQFAAAIKSKSGGFAHVGTVIFDELTVMALAMLNVVANSREVSGSNKLEPGALDQRDYNIAQNMVRKLLFDFTKCPDLSIICVGHERRDKVVGAKDNYKAAPAFPPAMWGTDVARLFHIVGRLTADIVVTPGKPNSYDRQIQVHGTNYIEAKSRVGGLKPKVHANELIQRIKEWSAGNEEIVDPLKETIELEESDLTGIEIE